MSSSSDDEIIPLRDSFNQEPVGVNQSLRNRRAINQIFGSGGSGGNELSQSLTRSGVTRRAIDDIKERYYEPGLSELDMLIKSTRNIDSSNSFAKKASQVINSTANSIIDLIAGQDATAILADDNQEMLMDIVDNSVTLVDMMRDLRKSFSSFTDDMIQPGSSLSSAVEMLGIDRSTSTALEEFKEVSNENKYDDFISELVSSGVPMDEATVAADAVDIDKNKSISAAELAKYDASENTVVNKVIKDPRFRNRLVKRRPYSSIYGDDFSSQFNQTEFVDSSLALDSEAFNADNVAFG
jgi:hypothetical protein